MQIFKGLLIILTSLACIFIVLSAIAMADEKPVHPDYPFVFDVTGRIDRTSNKEIVVDDVLFKLSSSTQYHSYDTIFTTSSSFQKGDNIGIILKDKKSREALSIWLIKKGH